MIETPIHAYFHPTTIVVIDDNQLFLRGLDLELPEDNAYQLHHKPETALDAVNAVQETAPLARRVFAPASASRDMSYATVALDLSLIEQEINLVDRFRRVSVAVIDYAMPSMDGIEFCKAITNPDVKRLLLTGVADEKLAVAAFNEGLIDRFLAKQNVTALDTIFQYVDGLVEQYFADLQTQLDHVLGEALRRYNDSAAFKRHFSDIVDRHGIVEYYNVGGPSGFLMLDAAGLLKRMLVTTPGEQSQQADWAAARGAPTDVVTDLSNGSVIGYFTEPPETFFDQSGFDWTNYLYVATRIDDEFRVALVDDPPTDIDYRPEHTSFAACAQTLGRATMTDV